MTHTPGPWKVFSWPANNSCDEGDPTWTYGFESPNNGDTFAEHEANARIMQAAPQLLEALEDADEMCQQGLNSTDPGHWEAALQDIMQAARAAIALAKGEST